KPSWCRRPYDSKFRVYLKKTKDDEDSSLRSLSMQSSNIPTERTASNSTMVGLHTSYSTTSAFWTIWRKAICAAVGIVEGKLSGQCLAEIVPTELQLPLRS